MGLDCMGMVGVMLFIPPEVLMVGGQTNKEDTLSWRHSYDAQWRHNHDTDCQHDAKPLPVVCRPQYTCKLVPSEHWRTPLTDWGSDKMAAIFQCIFLNENFWILNEISLKYVPQGLIDNMASLVQIMAWRRSGIIYWCIYASLGLNGLTHWPQGDQTEIFG